LISNAVKSYREDVEHRRFPSEEESYHLSKETLAALEAEESRVQLKAW
jgi:hypothetical protein